MREFSVSSFAQALPQVQPGGNVRHLSIDHVAGSFSRAFSHTITHVRSPQLSSSFSFCSAAVWVHPAPSPTARLLLLHGLGEHRFKTSPQPLSRAYSPVQPHAAAATSPTQSLLWLPPTSKVAACARAAQPCPARASLAATHVDAAFSIHASSSTQLHITRLYYLHPLSSLSYLLTSSCSIRLSRPRCQVKQTPFV